MGAKAVDVAVAALAALRLSAEPSSTVRMRTNENRLHLTPHIPLPGIHPARQKLRQGSGRPDRIGSWIGQRDGSNAPWAVPQGDWSVLSAALLPVGLARGWDAGCGICGLCCVLTAA